MIYDMFFSGSSSFVVPPFGCKPTEIWSRPSLMVFGLLDL